MTGRPGMIVAVDGPSGSGKSSVCRAVARTVGYEYLDTGAMYRCAAVWCHLEGISLDDAAAVADGVAGTPERPRFPVTIPFDPDDQRWLLDARTGTVDVTDRIREPAVSAVVSKVATNLKARAVLVGWQRDLVAERAESGQGLIVEGRDITTVIAPEAPVRVLLTASEEARLARRAVDNTGRADAIALAATTDEVLRRDRDDSTVAQFMIAADGVMTIDTTTLSFDASVDALMAVIAEAGHR